MSLSCSCDYDGDGWWYCGPDDYQKMPPVAIRRRCCSCKSVIQWGSLCTSFQRYRGPTSDIEERINGDEIGLASWWMCEPCSDLYFSLDELGFCINLGDDMRELVKEYAEYYGKAS